LLSRSNARGPDLREPAARDHDVVGQGQLTAEVDRHAGENVVPDLGRIPQRAAQPFVPDLLEVREVDGVVDVVVRVEVTPADLVVPRVHERASSVWERSPYASRSIRMPAAREDSGIASIACFVSETATGGSSERPRASSSARSSDVPAGTTSVTSPQ